MGDFFDQVERNKTIEIAKMMYQDDNNTTTALSVIRHGLGVSLEEAQEIFDAEVFGAVVA